MVGGSRRAGRALRRGSQRQLFCNILSINALITMVSVATTPNIEMSVWLLCSCEAAINNARIVAATIIYCSEANRVIWKNEGCLEPDVDVKVKLKWGWSLNAAQTEYRSGRRLLECLPGKVKQECPNNNAAHRSIISMIRKSDISRNVFLATTKTQGQYFRNFLDTCGTWGPSVNWGFLKRRRIATYSAVSLLKTKKCRIIS